MRLKHLLSAFTSVIIALGSITIPSITHAQPYFEGKTMTMVLGTAPGGRRDRIARTTARFLSQYIPGEPRVLVQNIPGGQGIPAQRKFNRGRTDGSMIAIVTSSDMEAPFFGSPGANYNPKDYVWVGALGTGKQRNILFTHKQAGFDSLEDLRSREVSLGGRTVGHRAYLYGRLIAEVMGFKKVRWILGYSSPELFIAIERGEVDGRVNDAATVLRNRPDWFSEKLIVPHVAMTIPKNLPPIDDPLLANVPSIMQFAKTDLHRDIIQKLNTTDRLGGAVAFPPGTPDHIRRIVEKALLKMGKDPKFKTYWEREVGIKPFQGAFSAAQVEESVKIYTTWRPEVLKAYKRLGYEAPK